MAAEMNHAMIPLTNEHFAAWCLKMLGQPYWYATCLYKCSEGLRVRKTAQYPAHYGSSRTARYRQDTAAKKVAADCIGAAKGYAWTSGGVGVLESIGADRSFVNRYGANDCPDKSANGMFTYAKSKGMAWGKIGTLPETVGLALHKNGHVGYYVGNSYAVEWKGFAYGCVKTKVAGRGWQYWYRLPFINYEPVPTPDAPIEPSVRVLSYTPGKAMARGEDVRALQLDLKALGYACGTADGIFGAKTSAAVVAFQRDHGLEVDGIVGKQTRAALEEALQASDRQDGGQDPQAQAQDPSDEHDEGQAPDGAEPGAAVGAEPDSDEGDADEDDEEAYTPPSDEEPLDYGTRLLRYRGSRSMMTGSDVAAVQNRLIQLGYNPGKADGIYGPSTAAAVKALQKGAKIEVDGIVGNDTRKVLRDGHISVGRNAGGAQ